MIRNHLRVLRTSHLLPHYSDSDLLDWSQLFDLGDIGYGAGDPADLAFDVHGNLIVALAGVDEVAITASPEQAPRRIVVGRRPTAVLPSPDGRWVYVADSLDDTISVVEIATGLRTATISLGPRPDLTPTDRGERLFSSARLSHDGWMSCHSCHTDGHTNNLSSDTLGDGSYRCSQTSPIPPGRRGDRTMDLDWLDLATRRPDPQVDRDDNARNQDHRGTGWRTGCLFTLALATVGRGDGRRRGLTRRLSRVAARSSKRANAASCHASPEYTSPQRYDVGSDRRGRES